MSVDEAHLAHLERAHPFADAAELSTEGAAALAHEQLLSELRTVGERPPFTGEVVNTVRTDPRVPVAAAKLAGVAQHHGWATGIVLALGVPLTYTWERRVAGWLLSESTSVRGRKTVDGAVFGFSCAWTRTGIPPRLTPKQRAQHGEPEDSQRISPVGLRWEPVGGHAWEVCLDLKCTHKAVGEHPAGIPVHLNVTELGKAIRA